MSPKFTVNDLRKILHSGRSLLSDGKNPHLTDASVPEGTQEARATIRPPWPEVWMQVARDLSERSYDPRLKVGAIIVPEDNTGILALGYNGNFMGGPNEPESMEPGGSAFIHAETNACIKCPYHYPVTKHMYVTHSPCRMCCKLIVNAGIKRVVYDIEYRDSSGLDDVLAKAGVEVFSLAQLRHNT